MIRRARGFLRSTIAFSLIELLVVIGIIGVLASMLMPAVSRAKGRANDVKCISNLRQIGIALSIYADENQGRLPYAERLPTQPVNPTNVLPRIVDVLSNNVAGAMQIFRCPRDIGFKGAPSFFKTEGSSYEWNYQANGQPIVLPGVIQGVQMTAVKARLMYDYENFHPGSTNGTKNVLHGDGHVAPIL